MPIRNTPRSYGSVTKTFHWLTMLLMFTVIPLGIIAHGMSEDILNPAIASTTLDFTRAYLLFSLHKTLGVTIFFVALARILWAFTQPKPGLLNADNRLEATLAETIHWLLYGSLLLVPLTGWIHHAATSGFAPIRWPFGQSLPFVPKDAVIAATFAGLHMVLIWVLVLSILLHVAGALKHHLIDRDSTLRRMLPGTSDAPQPPEQHHSLLPLVAALAIWAAALAIGSIFGAYGGHSESESGHGHDQNHALEQVASDWQVTDGTLDFDILQLGSKVTGSFADWTADITFDDTAGPGPAGQVNVIISIGSLTLGSVTDQAKGPDFFDVETFPTATFSGQIDKTSGGYVATGPLTIRDHSIDVTLPFDLTLTDGTAEMTGTLPLSRLDFGVGTSMPDETSVGFAVDVTVSLKATRNK